MPELATAAAKPLPDITTGPPVTAPLTPAEIVRLRRRVYETVMVALRDAREVIHGSRKWSPVQLGLFKTLVAKVLPDLSATYAEVHKFGHGLQGMDRGMLEQIASGSELPVTEGLSEAEKMAVLKALGIDPSTIVNGSVLETEVHDARAPACDEGGGGGRPAGRSPSRRSSPPLRSRHRERIQTLRRILIYVLLGLPTFIEAGKKDIAHADTVATLQRGL